ncbi:MAG: branched-chain amino acid ABC transporter permease [Bacillota bacterium]
MINYLIAMGSLGLIYSLLALGLNLQWGYTGLINFGLVAFYAIGAYTSTLLSIHTSLPLPFTIAAGVLVAGVLAYPIGKVSLRLKSDYLAIVTIGFAEVIRLLILNETWATRGAIGITDVPMLFGSFKGDVRQVVFLLFAIAMVAGVYLFLQHLTRSPFGRTLQAIKANEDAARALGKDAGSFKMWSLMIGAGISGLAGAIYAHYMRFVSPDQFMSDVTFYVWIGLIIGGSGKHLGALAGTFVLMLFLEGTRFMKDFLPGVDATKLAALRLMIVGLSLVILLLFRPDGLMSRRKEAA